MAKDIKETLKEGTEGILSEEVLNEIEAAFNDAVSQKALLQVEAALVQQDEDHATMLEDEVALQLVEPLQHRGAEAHLSDLRVHQQVVLNALQGAWSCSA